MKLILKSSASCFRVTGELMFEPRPVRHCDSKHRAEIEAIFAQLQRDKTARSGTAGAAC